MRLNLRNDEHWAGNPKVRVCFDHPNVKFCVTFFGAFFSMEYRGMANSHITRRLRSRFACFLARTFGNFRQFGFLDLSYQFHELRLCRRAHFERHFSGKMYLK